MESKQPPSHEQSDLETPNSELEENQNAEASASVSDHKPIKPEVSYVISGEVLRALIDEKPKASRFHAISHNPLIAAVFGILIGGILTAFYSYQQKILEYRLGMQQQELARRQSFSDEVNRLRIQKLGEVWERLDEDEFAINRLLDDSTFEGPSKNSSSNNSKRAAEITRLIHNDQVMASKYQFWLGEVQFHKAEGYLDANIKYALNKLGATPESDSSQLSKERENAKQDILQIRSSFLEGEPRAQPKGLDK